MPVVRVPPHRDSLVPRSFAESFFVRRAVVACSCLLAGGVFAEPVRADATAPAAGAEFRKLWDAPLSVTWPGIELRTALGRLTDARDVAVLVDRRVDPSTEIRLERSDIPLGHVLSDLATASRSGLSLVRHAVYLGPVETVRRLRTIIEVRETELTAGGTRNVDEATCKALLRGRDFAWDDLAEPRELVLDWSRLYGLEVVGVEQLPHDLWAAGRWPELTATEGLTLLLCQFDLGFEWREVDGRVTAITIGPLPEDPRVERSYTPPRGSTTAELIDAWRSERPLARIDAVGKQLRVSATVEDHEHFALLLKSGARTGPDARPRSPNASKNADSIALKRFTLKLADVPAQALLDTLARNGDARLTYTHDRAAFERAGIAFGKKVSVDVKNADIDQLLSQIARGLGIDYERRDREVEWKLPADRRSGTAPAARGANP